MQIDKRLVVPEWSVMTLWADMGFHLVPSAALAIDLLFFSPPWTLGTVPAIALSSVIAMIYWVWIETCYAYNGW